MESIELALEQARRNGTSIEVKKEMMDVTEPGDLLVPQGGIGASANNAWNVDDLSVGSSQYWQHHIDHILERRT